MATHGGNIHKVKRKQQGEQKIIDFSASINPFGPPPDIRGVISGAIADIIHYPDPEYTDLKQALSKRYGVPESRLVVGNGTTEILYQLFRTLQPKRVVLPVPSYIDYLKVIQQAEIDYELVYLEEKCNFILDFNDLSSRLQTGDLVLIGSPNNPTGQYCDHETIVSLAQKHRDVQFLIDEAFIDFVEGAKCVGGVEPNVQTLNSLTKFYSIPGLRLGFGVFEEEIADDINNNLPPWSINTIAEHVGIACLKDTAFYKESLRQMESTRELFLSGLKKVPAIKVYPTAANFVLVKVLNRQKAAVLYEKMLEHGLIVRSCENFEGLEKHYFRFAIKNDADNRKLLAALADVFGCKLVSAKKKTPSIMFQGTCSNAGKSILTTALCRILLQDGVKVAPFKAQNMSLNSFVTTGGGEIGRAQVVQAQAAKIDPDVRMNPVLLKPNSDTGSQVIVQGKAVGNMDVIKYGEYKQHAWKKVVESYDSLSSEYDAIVLEGAGSPGEVNLKREDIVNMRMASYADADVMLVGDIDRGGVYASFVGTMEVLDEWERGLIKGFIVNKFRGNSSLLASAHDYVLQRTGRYVVGVVPYVKNMAIPEEDSVSFKEGYLESTAPLEAGIDICVISLPHIANFTDIEPFYPEPDVHLRVIDHPDQLGSPDVIIIPGSKNVASDLAFLNSSGFSEGLNRCVEKGVETVGICGGYIMLGKAINDPYGIESAKSSMEGLGYLDFDTTLAENKSLLKREGVHNTSGMKITGYEIHHGITEGNSSPIFTFDDGSVCGHETAQRKIWGAYLHGMFDEDSFRRWFIDKKRVEKGLKPKGEILAPYDIERSLDRLADAVRDSVDMTGIYRSLGM